MVPSRSQPRTSETTWVKPKPGTMLVNVDGAIDFRRHRSAAGVLGRDSDGHCIGGVFVNLGFCSPLVCEL